VQVITPEKLSALLSALPDNPRVVASGNFAAPLALLNAMDAQLEHFRLFMLNAQPGIPARKGIRFETPFVGPGMRGKANLDYVPSRLSLVPLLFRQHHVPNVVLLNASRSRAGKVSLGTEVNILPAAIEAARASCGIVIAQLNDKMPYTFGDAELDESLIDYAIEVSEPLATTEGSDKVSGGVSDEIAERVSTLIGDGATLQLGIGAIPNAVISRLGKLRGVGIYTEMFSDGVLALNAAGALDASRDLVASFVFGSQALYDWVDLNPRVRMTRTEFTNDPARIAKQPMMTSVNSALQVDLFDQANASYVRGQIYSGFGGSTDFIVGAMHSAGGRSIIALPSWHAKANVSTIVPIVTEHVTSFQHSNVVTEQGIANCFGNTQTQQAQNLIAHAAHPTARDELQAAATKMGLA
jgi:acyl-CoA hydrolase